MELIKGQVVASRAGRDVARFYMVVAVEGDRVLLANGGKRPLAQPKAKNIRHINPTTHILGAGQADTDQQLRAALAAYSANPGAKTRGG
ncbi:MAG: hypothetical protein ACK5L3_04765 [Oscillospiraceae bacterium]